MPSPCADPASTAVHACNSTAGSRLTLPPIGPHHHRRRRPPIRRAELRHRLRLPAAAAGPVRAGGCRTPRRGGLDPRRRLDGGRPAPPAADVKAAIRCLRHYRGTLGIDGTRIGVRGESAGGHLAALAGLTGAAHASLEGTEGIAQGGTTVGAVVDWYGISDVEALLPDAPGAHDPGPWPGSAGASSHTCFLRSFVSIAIGEAVIAGVSAALGAAG
ncbi:hypothetical protein AB0N14_30660 [Streptomyces sp. NPDC051104]|uniref:hypothetical protein n=1 Tax=Streptomyces sp. NPDC051104 TaxID=3155044 RepID=UPI0034470D61